MHNSLHFDSRRSVVIAPNGAVSCNNPLAAQIGLDILKKGGNAADAAVAVATALNVLEPCSTGIGGDAFCLFYDARQGHVKALNGSGRCPELLTHDRLISEGYGVDKPLPANHGHTVTVPGAAAAFVDTVKVFGGGQLSMAQILEPVINLAENGFPVSQITAHFWKTGEAQFLDPKNPGGSCFLLNGRTPKWGEHFQNPDLADTYRMLAAHGKEGFYEGRVAADIVEAVAAFGGVISLDDLKQHSSTFEDPISITYKGVQLWEIPPNGIGIVALIALNILSHFDLKAMGHNTAAYLHTVIEAIRLAFADVMSYGADPSASKVPILGLLSNDYAMDRKKLIQTERAMIVAAPGNPWQHDIGSDTVYLTVTDSQGNACSFIVSNYTGFGTGIVPKHCGFTLQNRGLNFSLQKGHPNMIAPMKRPLHTIIPALVTDSHTGGLLASYGVMGGFMQPQGHVQVLLNMLEFGMNPQQALDALRFCVGSGHSGPLGSVSLEEGIDPMVMETLRQWGHDVEGPVSGHARALFGRGHVITKGAWFSQNSEDVSDDPRCWWAGADPRSDGQAVGY